MKTTYLYSFFLLFLLSCDSKWKDVSANYYLSKKNIIDSTKYETYDELYLKGKIDRIRISDENPNIFMNKPQVLDNKFVFFEKCNPLNNDEIIFIKIDSNGKRIDSLSLNRNYSIINDYILDKNFYCSWFIDQDKNFKKLKNNNLFLLSDTTKIKKIAEKFVKNNIQFFITSKYSNDLSIDTCNYIISFNNNKLEKYNFLKEIDSDSDLKIKGNFRSGYTSKFKDISLVDEDKYYKFDNFFAHYFSKQIRRGISGNDLFSNTGVSGSTCNTYYGTYFLTVQNKSRLKLKIMNDNICAKQNTNEYKYHGDNFYTENFLDFFIIENYKYYYIIKK